MSKQLRSKPLSQAKIQSILSQNPSAKAAQISFPAATTPSLVSQTIVPQLITLRRKQEYDSLKPEEMLKEFLKFARRNSRSFALYGAFRQHERLHGKRNVQKDAGNPPTAPRLQA